MLALESLLRDAGPLRPPPPRVLVCGSRHLTRDCLPVARRLLSAYPRGTVVIHGAGPGEPGADELLGEVAVELGFVVEVYPPQVDSRGRWRSRAEGVRRNAQQLAWGMPTEFLALHTEAKLGRGTRDMVRRLVAASVPGRIILLSGAASALAPVRVVRDCPVLPFFRVEESPATHYRWTARGRVPEKDSRHG